MFQSEDFKNEIARGDFTISEVGPDGMVAMPLNSAGTDPIKAFTGYAVDSTDHNMLIASTYY